MELVIDGKAGSNCAFCQAGVVHEHKARTRPDQDKMIKSPERAKEILNGYRS